MPFSGYYLAPISPATSVVTAVRANFTRPDEQDLIVAHASSLRIYAMGPEGIVPTRQISIYGRVSSMMAYRTEGHNLDLLLVFTEQGGITVMSHQPSTGQDVSLASGDMQDRVSRLSHAGIISDIHPSGRWAVFHLAQGLLKFLPLTTGLPAMDIPTPGEAFNVNIEPYHVLDISFLNSPPSPELGTDDPKGKKRKRVNAPANVPSRPSIIVALLWQNRRNRRFLSFHTLDPAAKELLDGPFLTREVSASGNRILPYQDGILVMGEQGSVYYSMKEGHPPVPAPLDHTVSETIASTCLINDPAFGYSKTVLIGSSSGELSLVRPSSADLAELAANPHMSRVSLGQVTIPTAIVYLADGHVFIGSHSGESYVIRLDPPSHLPGVSEPSSFTSGFQIVQTFSNLGPISDMCLVGGQDGGERRLVMCSGYGCSGALKILRSGIGINELIEMEVPKVTNLWSLPPGSITGAGQGSLAPSYLILGYPAETRVLRLLLSPDSSSPDVLESDDEADGQAEEILLPPLSIEGPTLHIAYLPAPLPSKLTKGLDPEGNILQVTPDGICMLRARHDRRSDPEEHLEILYRQQDTPEHAEDHINLATSHGNRIVIVHGGGSDLSLYQWRGQHAGMAKLTSWSYDQQVSCVDMGTTEYVAVGLWNDFSVHLSSISPAGAVTEIAVCHHPILPRSISIHSWDMGDARAASSNRATVYLFVALGDGKLYSRGFDPDTSTLGEAKVTIVGRQAATIQPIRYRQQGVEHVALFTAGSEWPCLIHPREDGVGITQGRSGIPGATTMSLTSHLSYSRVPHRYSEGLVVPIDLASERNEACMAISSPDMLIIGRIDALRRLQMQSLLLSAMTGRPGEEARRVTHIPGDISAFVLLTMCPPSSPLAEESSRVLLIDDGSDQCQVLDTIELLPREWAWSVAVGTFAVEGTSGSPRPYIVVGTAFEDPHAGAEGEACKRGMIRVYEAIGGGTPNRRLRTVSSVQVQGAVFSCLFSPLGRPEVGTTTPSHAALLAGGPPSPGHVEPDSTSLPSIFVTAIGSSVQSWNWDAEKECLIPGRSIGGFTQALSLDSTYPHGKDIVARDLMWGSAVLEVGPPPATESGQGSLADRKGPTLSKVARNGEEVWSTAIAAIDERRLLISDMYGMLRVQERVPRLSIGGGGADDPYGGGETYLFHEPYTRKVVDEINSIGHFQLGQQVNSIIHGVFGDEASGFYEGEGPVAGDVLGGGEKHALIIGTGHGEILRATPIMDREEFVMLSRLQQEIGRRVRRDGSWGGGFNYFEWRGMEKDLAEDGAGWFIDGLLVQGFLDLGEEEREQVWSKMVEDFSELLKIEGGLGNLIRILESLSRGS